jgi:hypothetical protein
VGSDVSFGCEGLHGDQSTDLQFVVNVTSVTS